MTIKFFRADFKADSLYDGVALLNYAVDKMELKNDAALARALNVSPPIISKIRHRVTPVSYGVMLRIGEKTGLSFADMREILGMPDPYTKK